MRGLPRPVWADYAQKVLRRVPEVVLPELPGKAGRADSVPELSGAHEAAPLEGGPGPAQGEGVDLLPAVEAHFHFRLRRKGRPGQSGAGPREHRNNK